MRKSIVLSYQSLGEGNKKDSQTHVAFNLKCWKRNKTCTGYSISEYLNFKTYSIFLFVLYTWKKNLATPLHVSTYTLKSDKKKKINNFEFITCIHPLWYPCSDMHLYRGNFKRLNYLILSDIWEKRIHENNFRNDIIIIYIYIKIYFCNRFQWPLYKKNFHSIYICSIWWRTFRCTAQQCSSERAWIDMGTGCLNQYSSGGLCLTLFVTHIYIYIYIYIYCLTTQHQKYRVRLYNRQWAHIQLELMV